MNEQRDIGSRQSADPKKLDIYKTAFEEGVRTLERQDADVDRLRTRTLTLVTVTVASTAFFVGQAVMHGNRGSWFYAALSVGSVLAVAILAIAAYVLWPIRNWLIEVSPSIIVTWADDSDNMAETYRDLARVYSEAAESNRKPSQKRRNALFGAVACTFALLLNWLVLAWSVTR